MNKPDRELVNDEVIEDFDENEDTQEGRFLTFQIAKEIYAIEIRHITEIVGIQKITEVPDMPSYVKGVINLRGSVIPVVDVRLRFNKEDIPYTDRSCLIVVTINDELVGLAVDTVKEVISIDDENISPPPSITKDGLNKYVNGVARVAEDVIMLLAIGKLLYDQNTLHE